MSTKAPQFALVIGLGLGLAGTLSGQQPAAQPRAAATNAASTDQKPSASVSDDPVDRIRDEGMNRSQVMQTLGYLSDVIGPRLTGSPNLHRANEWTRDTLTGWGLTNAHLEPWGPFGRGWSLQRFSAQILEPQAIPLIGFPKAWSPGFEYPHLGDVMFLDATNETDLDKYKGKLKGAIVLLGQPRDLKARFDPLGARLNETNLLRLANAGDGNQISARRQPASTASGTNSLALPSRRGPWETNSPALMPQITLNAEDYNRLVRTLKHGEKLKMEVDLQVRYYTNDLMAYNTIAEIPGTDLKNQIVMLGAHMDSWHSGTGATDNGAGVAVTMEVVRILQAAKLQPRRTIRIGLWTGEEEGLLGSKAYVAAHFGKASTNRTSTSTSTSAGSTSASGAPAASDESKDGSATRSKTNSNSKSKNGRSQPPATVTVQHGPEFENLSVYFNLDNGTGKIRGIYLQGNEGARPIFRKWMAPFRDDGAETISLANTFGTDHTTFNDIGLPGFQFIQDPIEYDTRTHHTNMDVLDRIQEEDLKQASVIMAAFVYHAATMDDRFPRKPMN